jgi:signal transduction histidine kinase
MKGSYARIVISVVVSGLLPVAGGLICYWGMPALAGEWTWHSESLHSMMEAVGAFSALTLGILMVLLAQQRKTFHPHLWIASALVVKGTLDLLHAALGANLPFAWLRGLTTLIGGALFAAVWLPERLVRQRRLVILPFAAAVGAVVLALVAIALPHFRHDTMPPEAFTPIFGASSTIGGLLYVAAAVCFLTRYRNGGQTDDLLWSNVSLLFGACGLMFAPSLYWNYTWWFWHLMRLLAYLLCVGYFFGTYAQAEKVVREAHESLTREVAQRTRAEERIREQNAFLKNIIESLSHPFYVIDAADYTIKIANSAAAFGTVSDYRTCYALTHCRDKPCEGVRHPCPVQAVQQTGQPAVIEHIHRDADGNAKTVEIHAHPILDATGSVSQVIEYCLDITERKSHEKERERLIAELASKNAELERFTYTVSHDLKSPLITIKGFLGYLERDMISGNLERLRADTARIHGAVAKMSQLLDELLELSRIGRIVNPPQDVPLAELVGPAIDILTGRIVEKGITVDIPQQLPVLYGDAARLREVVENLLDNAVKFMGDQPYPRLEIEVREHSAKDIVCVKDNGVGIDPRYQAKIFQLFERVEQDVEGTGIGLAIVKRIVEVHGGQIWVESEGAGQGSLFCFALPKKRKDCSTDPE